MCLLRNNISWCCVFAWTPFGARGNSCCQLCLRLVVTTYPPSNLPFFQAEVFCNLAPCFSCFTHSYDFWFNGLDLCVFPL